MRKLRREMVCIGMRSTLLQSCTEGPLSYDFLPSSGQGRGCKCLLTLWSRGGLLRGSGGVAGGRSAGHVVGPVARLRNATCVHVL